MALKIFYKNFEKQKFIENNLFSKLVYSKHFVRSDQDYLNNIQLIDNHGNCANVFSDTTPIPGSSFFSSHVIRKHVYDDNIRFISFLNYTKSNAKSQISCNLYKALRFITKNKNSRSLLLIINPVKGGFTAYSCGLLAFLPKGQKKFCRNRQPKAQSSKTYSLLRYFSFFSQKSHILRNFFCIFVPLFKIKITVYSNLKRYNYSLPTALRRRKISKFRLNFLFLISKEKRFKKRKFDKKSNLRKKKNYNKFHN